MQRHDPAGSMHQHEGDALRQTTREGLLIRQASAKIVSLVCGQGEKRCETPRTLPHTNGYITRASMHVLSHTHARTHAHVYTHTQTKKKKKKKEKEQDYAIQFRALQSDCKRKGVVHYLRVGHSRVVDLADDSFFRVRHSRIGMKRLRFIEE